MADTGERLRALYAGGVPMVFSAKVADYRASRPDYPAALFDEALMLPPAAVVADVGSGTGLFTRGLLARGHTVYAVEPSAEMREAAEAEFARRPTFHSVAGRAEATTLADRSVDLVSAAQAFHWFDISRARAECLRVLKPAGRVALVWNDRVLEDPVHRALDELFAEFGGDKRGALLAHEASRADAPAFFAGAPVHELNFDHTQRLDAGGLASLVFSRSYMPARDGAAGAQVVRHVHVLFDRLAQSDGVVTLRYRSAAIVGRPQA